MQLPRMIWWPFGKAQHHTQHHQQNPAKNTAQRHIAVPVDESDQSLKALEWTISNVYRAGDAVHLVSVVPHDCGPYPAEVLDSDLPCAPASAVKAWRTLQRAHESETEALLSLMSHHATNMGLAAGSVHTHPLEPRSAGKCPGEAIVDFVDRAGVDMVVIGSRGLEGWRRRLDDILGSGSVSVYTLMHVRCPVVVVKEQQGRVVATAQHHPQHPPAHK